MRRVEAVCLAALWLVDGATFTWTLGERAAWSFAPSDEVIIRAVVASLHSFPVASMPPLAPPAHSRACADREKSAAAINDMRGFAFMSEAPFLLALEPCRVPARNARGAIPTILPSLQRIEPHIPDRPS